MSEQERAITRKQIKGHAMKTAVSGYRGCVKGSKLRFYDGVIAW